MGTWASDRWQEALRYRRKTLVGRRTYFCDKIAFQTRQHGRPSASTSRALKNVEQRIREFNALAEELGLPKIR